MKFSSRLGLILDKLIECTFARCRNAVLSLLRSLISIHAISSQSVLSIGPLKRTENVVLKILEDSTVRGILLRGSCFHFMTRRKSGIR